MQQNELAKLLDISPAMVSRLAKRGMPTDDLERAKRWRKRHLEPGRVKGTRFNPTKPKQSTPPTGTPTPPALGASVEDMEAVGDLIDGALIRGKHDVVTLRIMQLRLMFRQSTNADKDESIRLTVRAWVALLGYVLHQEAEIRQYCDMAEYMTPGQFGERIAPGGCVWAAHTVLWECCDFDSNSVNGWPEEI